MTCDASADSKNATTAATSSGSASRDSGFALASGWFPILALETLLFAIGTAFIILVMAKERSVHIHRAEASTDPLTGISNRRGFLDEAERLMRKQAWKKQPVTVLMLFEAIFRTRLLPQSAM